MRRTRPLIGDALLPPALLAPLALLLLLAGKRRAAALVTLVLIALSTRLVSRLLLASLLLAGSQSGPPPQAIVVLPGDAPEAVNPSGREPALFTLDRLRTAAALQRKTALPVLVAGGAGAPALAESLRDDFGIPVRWEETRATNSWTSAAASAALLREAGVSRVFLVADAWDQRFASDLFRRAGLAVTPASVHRPDPLAFDRYALVPAAPEWLDSAVAIEQWSGLACSALPLCLSLVDPGARLDPGGAAPP